MASQRKAGQIEPSQQQPNSKPKATFHRRDRVRIREIHRGTRREDGFVLQKSQLPAANVRLSGLPFISCMAAVTLGTQFSQPTAQYFEAISFTS
jgi:hypothetical protein